MTTDARNHEHGPGCDHTGARNAHHIDYLRDGELHHHSGGAVERHEVSVSDRNPAACTPDHD